VDLLSISVDFCGSSVDLLWISVDLLWISVDGNYVIGLARFSEAGLRSNEVLFFGFFPFAIIFFGGGVDFGGFASIFCRWELRDWTREILRCGQRRLRAAAGMALPSLRRSAPCFCPQSLAQNSKKSGQNNRTKRGG
jgi:hypothetical protein